MVVIRLARGGAKKRPFYNIVVAAKAERRDGRFIERVGFYNPMAAGGEQPLRLALDRVSYWSGVGAQLSPTVQRLVERGLAAADADYLACGPGPLQRQGEGAADQANAKNNDLAEAETHRRASGRLPAPSPGPRGSARSRSPGRW